MNKHYNVCVIGGGAAGMAAALGAAEQGAKHIILIERDYELGGILQQCIHNGFGLHRYKEELTGPAFAQRLRNQLSDYNVTIKMETTVLKITQAQEVHLLNEYDGYQVIKPDSIIIATGSRERTRHQIDLPGKRLAGIMTAGMAQRYLNIDGYLVGKKVMILGSGDIGLIMARRMTLEGAEVLGVVELMPYSNGLNRNIVQCLHDYDIPLYLSHTVSHVSGTDRLKQLTISKVDQHFNVIEGTNQTFEADTLLLSVGLIPENNLLTELGVDINPVTKGAYVNGRFQTNVKGVFACGNALHVHDLVDYVTDEGYEAGTSAAIYAQSHKKDEPPTLLVKAETNIRYVIPNQVRVYDELDTVTFKYRVKKPLEDVTVLVKQQENVIKKVRKRHLLPAEMETLKVKRSYLKAQQDITITIEGDE